MCILQTNQDAQSMGVVRTKLAHSGTVVKYAVWGCYEMGNGGAWKIWQGNPHER